MKFMKFIEGWNWGHDATEDLDNMYLNPRIQGLKIVVTLLVEKEGFTSMCRLILVFNHEMAPRICAP